MGRKADRRHPYSLYTFPRRPAGRESGLGSGLAWSPALEAGTGAFPEFEWFRHGVSRRDAQFKP
ncbi:hypothetical protein AA0498_0878 [Acidomonas methanolica]|uniref:Uncharacterized protein n=1 Tax=Acidomonas methanolica NBRC 104435 TaxID=1231351 RepID=A0A023D748_ACIMT|nr:hypothetical protein Amme_093_016 [Acidomonas methanolica NBRC 104435]GBQ48994.1 hypothetical protein AA0498_0878 [Acidomonas methanolica]GEK99634.1 hypothetical protein AME01nite_21330 [Acidomonas methanolica NBRC 104435]